jgi:exonuclease VII large subunit
MSDKVLEQRVKRLENKLDLSIEQDHQRQTQLEDVLAGFIRSNQDGFAKLRHEMTDSQKRNDAEFARLQHALEESQRRNDVEFAKMRQETAKFQQQMADSQKCNDAGFAKLRQEMGNLSHRLGSLVEDLVAPSLPAILKQLVACPEDQEALVNVRIRRRHPSQPGKMLEIDAIADCGSYVLFNETKSQLTPEKVKAFLEKLTVVRDYFPEYPQYTILGSVAALAPMKD